MRLALPAFMAFLVAAGTLTAQDVIPGTVGKVPYEAGKGARLVEASETEIVETSLEHDGNIWCKVPSDPGGDKPNGARYYTFMLKPKETLLLRLKADDPNRVGLVAIRPPAKDKMASQFERSDRVPKPLRASRFEIQNITGEPYPLVVAAYGAVNYAYRITIERKP